MAAANTGCPQHRYYPALPPVPDDRCAFRRSNPGLRMKQHGQVRRSLWPLLTMLALWMPLPAHGEQALDVKVVTRKNVVVVDVRMVVDVDVPRAWSVLTDYAHMVQYLSDLRLSEVMSRRDNVLLVHQVGETRSGVLHFTYDTVRQVELTPMAEIRSKLVTGDFKSYSASTRLFPMTRGCVIVNHGEYVPNRWVPPLLGPALIEQGTRKQYAELRAEMLRR